MAHQGDDDEGLSEVPSLSNDSEIERKNKKWGKI
jgi:hypothetical protein